MRLNPNRRSTASALVGARDVRHPVASATSKSLEWFPLHIIIIFFLFFALLVIPLDIIIYHPLLLTDAISWRKAGAVTTNLTG